MWNVNLQHPPFHCFQTCHDPDCRRKQFRNTPTLLPEELSDWLQEQLFEEQLAQLDIPEKASSSTAPKRGEQSCGIDDEESFEQALAALSYCVFLLPIHSAANPKVYHARKTREPRQHSRETYLQITEN
jgi:hypothetical protein